MSSSETVPIRPTPQKLGCLVLAPAPLQVRSLAAARPGRRTLPCQPPARGAAMKQRGGYSAYVPSQQPSTVLRRNARERNRVKQVNHGFVALRNHIPGAARNKKLSKVDTLRRAMEYIQSLQRQLEEQSGCTAEQDSAPTPPPPPPPPDVAASYCADQADHKSQRLPPEQQPGYLTPKEESASSFLTPQSSPTACQPSPMTLTPSSLASADSGFSDGHGLAARPAWPLTACPDTPSPTPSYEPTLRLAASGYGCGEHAADGRQSLAELSEEFSAEDEELLDAIAWWQTSN